MTEIVLSVQDLAVRYNSSIRALEDVSITVEAGQVVALLGANGAGKTTLLRAVTGLLPHHRGLITHGTVEVFGRPLPQGNPAAAVRAGLAQVMEGRRLFRHLSVEENILTGTSTMPRSQRRPAAEALIARFPLLKERRTELAALLSGGQQQIVAIARALASSPKLLILDEPSLGLSPVAIQEVRAILNALKESGQSILIVEQNVQLALTLADQVYVLQRGRVISSGSPSDLGDNESITALYLGSTVEPDDQLDARSPALEKDVALPWLN